MRSGAVKFAPDLFDPDQEPAYRRTMTDPQAELQLVRNRVAEGEKHVRLQREILRHLREVGSATDVAEQILAEFEARLADERKREAGLVAALANTPPLPRPA
jgi:hypothetical protein